MVEELRWAVLLPELLDSLYLERGRLQQLVLLRLWGCCMWLCKLQVLQLGSIHTITNNLYYLLLDFSLCTQLQKGHKHCCTLKFWITVVGLYSTDQTNTILAPHQALSSEGNFVCERCQKAVYEWVFVQPRRGPKLYCPDPILAAFAAGQAPH